MSELGGRTPRSKKMKKRTHKRDREVLVHGSLPPLVDGQIRCFVVLKIHKVTWKTSKAPENVFLRVTWWGETGEGSIFSPSEQRCIARYPVRSGPKQMAAYLSDAATLHVDVLRSSDMAVIGKVQVYGLSSLAMGKALSGPYPIFSTKSEIIGHANVKLTVQGLNASDDSSSVVPTTDLDSTRSDKSKSVSRERLDSKLGTPDAYSSFKSSQEKVHRHSPSPPRLSPSEPPSILRPRRRSPVRRSHSDHDIISDILDRGQRLREAMITAGVARDIVEGGDPFVHCTKQKGDNPGVESCHRKFQDVTNLRRDHTERRTVDMFLNSPKKLAYLSDDEQFSSDLDFESDSDDPIHDPDILEELFYRRDSPHSSPSKVDACTNVTPPQSGHRSQSAADSRRDDLIDRSRAQHVHHSFGLERYGNERSSSRTRSASPSLQRGISPSYSQGDQSDVGSRVSFDMTPSDDEDMRSAAEGLSVQQLTLLARVNVARVHIDKLILRDRPTTPVEKKTYKGRPPSTPKAGKYGTYFVEYQFPVVAASRDEHERNASATETVRAVSKKVEKSDVRWDHHTVFPVYFDGQAVEKWWNSMLVLKVHFRDPSQKTANLIGSCSVPMKRLLQSLTFGLELELPVSKWKKGMKKRKIRRRAETLGVLKLNIQLASDSPSFTQALQELQLHHDRKRNPLLKPKPSTPQVPPRTPEYIKQQDIPHQATITNHDQRTNVQTMDMLLHAFLQVTECRLSTCEELIASDHVMSTYVICRTFWTEDKITSSICWKETNPNYDLTETVPIHLTPDLLLRMQGNYMVIEVWEKKLAPHSDKLLGMVKLPLNSLYMSFKDEKISKVLLKSQYPVLSVDSFLPIINPYSGKPVGKLRVVLALGSNEQIMSLHALKVVGMATVPQTSQKNIHTMEPVKDAPSNDAHPNYDKVEHSFMVQVLGVRQFKPEEDMFWGEADCFVQYHFPNQDHDEIKMRSYRTSTTLCTADPTFQHSQLHCYTLDRSQPIQAQLLSATGASHGSGVPFEVWCRFYHPNTRDQLLARAVLPLAKLCAMITMHRQTPASSQSFTLPLQHAAGDRKIGSAGWLDLSIQYMDPKPQSGVVPTDLIHTYGLLNVGRVTLGVTLESVTGLKSAALALAGKHKCLDYYATVGVNLYSKMALSFQPMQDVRINDTMARVFHGDVSQRTEFSLPLILNNVTSLAECIQTGSLVIELWHQNLKDAVLEDCPGVPMSTDIQLGVCSIPLQPLLTHKSGIRDWYPVNPPPGIYSTTQSHDPLLGGVKVQVNLTGSTDIQKIVDSASKLGYQSPDGLQVSEYVCDEMTQVTVEVDWLCVPAELALYTGQDMLPLASACYVKFNYYDCETFYSAPLSVQDKGESLECRSKVTAKFLHKSSTAYLWYLWDQSLEVQLWLSHDRDNRRRESITPSSQDKYLGSAYVPLCSLAQRSRAALSDVYPLYRERTDRMGRSLMQVHLTKSPLGREESPKSKKPANFRRSRSQPLTHDVTYSDSQSISQSEEDDDDDVIEITMSIDQANRLEVDEKQKTVHVSYNLAGRVHKTDQVQASEKPYWMYERLSKVNQQALLQAKHVVLKVWSGSSEVDRVIGFTTIDVRPLMSGLPELNGWYNIMDFTGQCRGQIKVGITPHSKISRSSQLRNVEQEIPSQIMQVDVNKYSTQSVYSSFPSHISRFPEQQLTLGNSSHSSASEQLRRNLADLDVITENMRRRLHGSSTATSSEEKVAVPSIFSHHQEDPSHTNKKRTLLDTVSRVNHNVQQLVQEGLVQEADIIPQLRGTISALRNDGSQSSHSNESCETVSTATFAVPSLNPSVVGENNSLKQVVPHMEFSSSSDDGRCHNGSSNQSSVYVSRETSPREEQVGDNSTPTQESSDIITTGAEVIEDLVVGCGEVDIDHRETLSASSQDSRSNSNSALQALDSTEPFSQFEPITDDVVLTMAAATDSHTQDVGGVTDDDVSPLANVGDEEPVISDEEIVEVESNYEESDGEYETEPANSRTLNEDISCLDDAPAFLDTSGNESALSSDNTLLSKCQSATDAMDFVFSGSYHRHSPGEVTSSQSAEQVPTETRTVGSNHGNTEDNLTDEHSDPTDQPSNSTIRDNTEDIEGIPSFFPSMQELEEQLKALTQQPERSDRFSRRPDRALVDQLTNPETADRIADIFSRKYD